MVVCGWRETLQLESKTDLPLNVLSDLQVELPVNGVAASPNNLDDRTKMAGSPPPPH